MSIYVAKVGENYVLKQAGKEDVVLEVKQPSGWDRTIFLPENESGRKLINVPKLDKILEKDGQYELKPKTIAAKSSTKSTTKVKLPMTEQDLHPDKADEDYLEGEERELFIQLRDKIQAAKTRPLSKKELLQMQIEKYKAELAKLEEETEETEEAEKSEEEQDHE